MSTSPTDENLLNSSKGSDDDSLSSPVYEAASQSNDASPVYQDPLERERQMLEWREELFKVEGEIATLRQVLGTKIRYASELKRKMGITPFQEFKTDFNTGLQQIKSSDSFLWTTNKVKMINTAVNNSPAYQKTNEKLHQINDKITQSTAYQKTAAVAKTAGEKTSAAISTIGSSMSRKLGDIRNSSTFKSLEESVGHTYANVKARVSGSRSSQSLDENAREMQTEGEHDQVTTPDSLPEEKVPL